MLTTWIGQRYYLANADLVLTGDGYWIGMTDFDADPPGQVKQHFDDLDTFVEALKAISERWWISGTWVCFTRRDVALYQVTKDVLWGGNPKVRDYTGLLTDAGTRRPAAQQLELFG